MDLRKLNDRISVAPQIRPDEVAAVAAAGFRTLICNRPDDEEMGQPDAATMAAAAAAAGLTFLHVPAISGQFTSACIADFGEALRTAEMPVLAYCRSGTRSCMLWALANPDGETAPALVETAAGAGYDIRALAPNLGPAR
jgi:uncharacterized protein (TIGR01244 family)